MNRHILLEAHSFCQEAVVYVRTFKFFHLLFFNFSCIYNTRVVKGEDLYVGVCMCLLLCFGVFLCLFCMCGLGWEEPLEDIL